MKAKKSEKVVDKSKPIDMVYEGIAKQEDALKELSRKRKGINTKERGSKFKGGLYAGRYED